MTDQPEPEPEIVTVTQQAVPVAQESLFDVHPQVSVIDNGPEPSIREMVRSFYNRHAVKNPDAVTEQYFAALSLPCKSGEGEETVRDAILDILTPLHWETWKAALFDSRHSWPDEDEQEQIARQVDDISVLEHADAWVKPAADAIIAALTPDATQAREVEDPAKIALDAYNQGYRDGCEDSGAEADMESARDGWHDWLHDCEALKLDDAALSAGSAGQ